MEKSSVKLTLFREVSMAYWGDQLLPVSGKQFDILCKLAQRPREVVTRQDLCSLIESRKYKDLLLRQYIANIRRVFPPPYSDPHHPKGIIKTRKMKGYYLNLSPDQVEIVRIKCNSECY